jgi:hypothetical protein
MKLSLVEAEVKWMSEGTNSLAWMFEWTLMPPFFQPVLGCRPAPLNSRLKNSVMVAESMI